MESYLNILNFWWSDISPRSVKTGSKENSKFYIYTHTQTHMDKVGRERKRERETEGVKDDKLNIQIDEKLA